MLFFTVFTFFLTLLSTVLSQPVDDILPRSLGAVKIVNSLSAPIYAWSVADKEGSMHMLSAKGGTYEEVWRVNPKDGRISIKVSTKPDLKANDVIQFEYEMSGDKVDWGVSCSDLRLPSEFTTRGFSVQPSSKDCPSISCAPGDEHCSQVHPWRLQEYEQLRQDMEKAWRTYLPTVDLQEALRTVRESRQVAPVNTSQDTKLSTEVEHHTEQLPTNFTEHSNAEDYEFDESQDFDNSIDGMGFLTADPHKAGYTGPQSGIAALKFLQSLPLYLPLNSVNTPSSLDEDDFPAARSQSMATVSRYIDDYFALYHPAYPILHEGTFRARISGALAKPRDGSWPLLYNTVLAIGAFVGDSNATKCDIPFYKEARKHLTMDVLEKGSLSYVQAIVIMANYLQKRNKPNAGFILIGIGFSMALAIGLHREFGMPSTSPFTMEIRRRVWWTLFVFVSGAQLTLGRPAVSLVGVNIRLPANLDDQDIAVDMEHLPECKPGPTITSALIAQVKLAKIANAVQVELLTHHVPRYERAVKLEENIGNWWKDLPPYFNQEVNLEPHLELPKRVLLWRSFHLRIVLNRPFLFEAIATRSAISTSEGPINSCLSAADECVTSICGFLNHTDSRKRGLAWYATYWLITASFVQATCYIYSPTHTMAPSWKGHLQQAVDCLESLGSSHDMAFRARNVLQKLLEQGHAVDLTQNISPNPTTAVTRPSRFWAPPPGAQNQAIYNPLSMGLEDSFTWYPQGMSNAELLDAAGGFMIQNFFEGSEGHSGTSPWMGM
ncbi:specific transcription factor domain protein [Aspergillus parasiticus SU-1]|uniref:Specific transcription factor domain protein n=1 Tax=Aspergillus parasiticus (strain ATCC 56775 / NRRL 5862 / SRRC 143 / SU-1) TaxID=1403190 RepID=A0A0F0I532_ASPPU|nr:specific transcription factor domain protein [Aspergillus parasiticus SU-1]